MRRAASTRSAAALIVTLALVVLLTFVVVAFFSRATANRQIESASANRSAADILAKSGIDSVVADLKTEIIAGSNRLGAPSEPPFYAPKKPLNMLPSRAVTTGAAGAGFVNLVKQSGGGRFFPATADYSSIELLLREDSGVRTDVPSVNKRVVSAGRWDMPMLTAPTANPTPPAKSNFTSNALPNWVLMTRAGVPSSQTWKPSFKDYVTGNQDAVVGRFAFNVYDIGGLLDVNVIGLPDTVTSAGEIQKYKGTLTGADLSGIAPTAPIVRKPFTNWKYRASFGSGSATNSGSGTAQEMDKAWDRLRNGGFLQPWHDAVAAHSDLMVFSRQDLIRATSIPANAFADPGVTPAALPYLTHFSREVNAPSAWRFSQRVSAPFTSFDGTKLQTGEQVIRRFPLTKLNWVGPTGVNTSSTVDKAGLIQTSKTNITAGDVQVTFGLCWASDHWVYCGPPPGSAARDAVAIIPNDREANFFELIADAKRKVTGSADIAEVLSIGASMIDHNDGASAATLDPTNTITSIEYLAPNVTPNPRAWGMESPGPSPYPSAAPTPPPNATVLNHTIRTVGEFGYAYKADKLQTVNLSASSDDREILDLFTVSPPRLRAGVVNLNTRNVEVMKALLRKSLKQESGSAQVSDGEADATATAVVAETSAGGKPAETRADIARLAASGAISGGEEEKEAVARSFGEVTQTRTWNLLIDVIAQSGRFTPSASQAEDFVVTGEQRYWLSIALDRDTASVIDQQLESVLE